MDHIGQVLEPAATPS